MNRRVRNIEIRGHRTSFKLEEPFWRAAQNRARESQMSIDDLFTEIVFEHRDPKATMTSAVRTYLICGLRDQALQGERERGVA